MSDKLPTEISVGEQARAAGRREPRADGGDEITDLRDHCKAFIDNLALRLGESRAHQISMSRSMLEQMVFWLRSARQ
ncbi:MAG TPA: hypothetical protein VK741_22825 [Acetobacteraceae bacterium]|nr:hypothetical protein [Acetobacteraceae bacterium]